MQCARGHGHTEGYVGHGFLTPTRQMELLAVYRLCRGEYMNNDRIDCKSRNSDTHEMYFGTQRATPLEEKATRASRVASILLAASLLSIPWCSNAAAQRHSRVKADLAAQVQFSFDRTPWRAILEWLADETGLALHIGSLPVGTFTYHDSRRYTLDHAIGRINLFLIPKRFVLIRSSELLSVINLDDMSSVRQLDAVARVVAPQNLDELGSHDVVKCVFPLGDTHADVALQELSELFLIRKPTVLQATNQLLIIDTAEKLVLARNLLAELSNPVAARGRIKSFPLNGLDAQRVLSLIRPHVGLGPMDNIGLDINLSVDADTSQLLATGSKENLDAVSSVIEILSATTRNEGEPADQFRTHEVGEADLQTVVNVLETLLSDSGARLAPDPVSDQIAVMGSERVHSTVARTIQQLSGANAITFKAIPLRSVDSQYALRVVEEMFHLAGEADVDANSTSVEADPISNRLFVRGRPGKIAQIEDAVTAMEPRLFRTDAGVRFLPYRGDRGRRALEAARDFWPYEEELRILPDPRQPRPVEREVGAGSGHRSPADDSTDSAGSNSGLLPEHLVSVHSANEARDVENDTRATIQARWTPTGIVALGTDDALARFERHLEIVAGPAYGGEGESRLAVFYLKHAEVEAANDLLTQLLDAEQDRLPGELTRLGDYGPWDAGMTTVIPDARLNRIFVYGREERLNAIERHLAMIDRERGLTEIKTRGIPRIVRLKHAPASKVAEILRDAFEGRIADSRQERRAAAARNAKEQQPKAPFSKNAQAEATPIAVALVKSGTSSHQDPKITLAVDETGNALVITAPELLATQVERLAKEIDAHSIQSVRIKTVQSGSANAVYQAISKTFGAPIKSRSATK